MQLAMDPATEPLAQHSESRPEINESAEHTKWSIISQNIKKEPFNLYTSLLMLYCCCRQLYIIGFTLTQSRFFSSLVTLKFFLFDAALVTILISKKYRNKALTQKTALLIALAVSIPIEILRYLHVATEHRFGYDESFFYSLIRETYLVSMIILLCRPNLRYFQPIL